MTQVLFTHSYYYKFDPKQWSTKQPYPPLATILAASIVRQAGYSVSLFDTNLRDEPKEIEIVISKDSPRYLVIYDDGFNYLSKMCLTNMRVAAFSMIQSGKSAGCTVIVSSSDATDHVKQYLDCGTDFVVKGEGEETLLDLLSTLEKEEDTSFIPGIAYKANNKIISTNQRPVIKDLDLLPMPAWDLIDIESYRKIWMSHHGYFSLNLASTRGCPFKCNWCAKPIYGNRYNSRSPKHVLREIEFLINKYQVNHFWMCDDIFGLKPGWVQDFSELVAKSGLKFKYKIQSRVDLLLQENTIDALAESGAETIWVGAESGAQKILDAMDKGTSVSQIYEATHLLKKKNIKVAFFLQFGYPGEIQQDIDATIQMVLDLMPDEIGISISYPLPGTKFFENVKDQLIDKQNWTDSDDLAMMFEGTYTKEFYRQLHRYVHSVYRIKRGKNSFKKLAKNPLNINYKDVKNGAASFYFAAQAYQLNRKLRKLRSAKLADYKL